MVVPQGIDGRSMSYQGHHAKALGCLSVLLLPKNALHHTQLVSVLSSVICQLVGEDDAWSEKNNPQSVEKYLPLWWVYLLSGITEFGVSEGSLFVMLMVLVVHGTNRAGV